jgi:tetratricopeptide (TPR) repeat protein
MNFIFVIEARLREVYRAVVPLWARRYLTPLSYRVIALTTARLRRRGRDADPNSEEMTTQQNIGELPQLAEQKAALDAEEAVRRAWGAVGTDEYSSSAFIAVGKALLAKADRAEFDRAAEMVRDRGLILIERGELERAAAFFDETAEVFATTPEQLLAQKRFDELVRLVERRFAQDPDERIRLCGGAIGNDQYLASAYVVMGKAQLAKGDQTEFDRLAATVRDKGLGLIARGELARGAAFFDEASEGFPDICRGYALLFGLMNRLTVYYRMQPPLVAGSARRRLIIALSVWGDRYVDLFLRYFIPSLLSPNNLPALRHIRDVSFDISAPERFIKSIKESAIYAELRRYSDVNFIAFSDEILASPEYSLFPAYRYHIYGGFHHIAIEHARAMGADVICIAPDGVHSDGSFTNYARFVDQGYKAVLFTATRGQAETLLPILDSLRDENTQSLTLPSRTLVALSLAHVHHNFKRFIMTKGNRGIPPGLSLMFFPNRHGFHIRCFHIHPIILAADAVKKDIAFDYFTVDSNSLSRLFPDPESWKQIKIIEHSDDGVMMDLAYSSEEEQYPECEFEPAQLLRQLPGYGANHFWHFSRRIVYHTDDDIEFVGTFDRKADGTLERKFLPVSSAIDMTDDELYAWFEANRPK